MKKTSVVVLLAVGVLFLSSGRVLGGAYDELLPEAVKGKTFVPSFMVKWEYDDNVFAGDESWKLYAEPKIDIHWLSPESYFGLGYQYSFIWYEDRVDDTDMAHDALFDIRHQFTPSIEVAVRDLFRFTQEPATPEEILGMPREVSHRTMGDYLYNRASVALNIETGKGLWWNLSYANLAVDYDEDLASDLFDRMGHTGAVRLQYLATPQSKINVGGSFADMDYDSDVGKDSEDWIGYVGLDQELTKKCIASIVAGWENRDFSELDESADAPYVDASLAAQLGKRGNGRIGYRHSFAETFSPFFALREVDTIYGGLNAFLAHWTSLHINTSYEMGELETPGEGDNVDEDVWLLGAAVRQHVRKDMYFEAGYRRTDVESDFEGSTFDRNRFYIGFGGIF